MEGGSGMPNATLGWHLSGAQYLVVLSEQKLAFP